MYQYSYGAILADSPVDAREQERQAFDHAIGLLRRSGAGAGAAVEAEAIGFTNRLWAVLIEDLARPDNDLPHTLRAQLMSVGLWVMGQACAIERGDTRDFESIAEICGIVRDGLN